MSFKSFQRTERQHRVHWHSGHGGTKAILPLEHYMLAKGFADRPMQGQNCDTVGREGVEWLDGLNHAHIHWFSLAGLLEQASF